MSNIDNPEVAAKLTMPICRRCKAELHRRHRTILVKTLLFWLPLKKYYCYGCLRYRWRWEP
jgi:hypothetical protein